MSISAKTADVARESLPDSDHPLLVPSVRPRRRRSRWRRRLAVGGSAALLLVVGLWIAVHRVSWLGPALADGLRSVFGPATVAWLEDVAYGIQDRVDRWRYRNAEPKTFWELPDGLPKAPPPAKDSAFRPAVFEPPFPEVATSLDGRWLPVPDPLDSRAAPALFKSLVHPDVERNFAALAVVAVDLKALDLHLVAGTREPHSNIIPRSERPGVIPESHRAHLVAAFNGGFKATHGQYGMNLNGQQYLPPRDFACTLARYRDGSMGIGTWSRIAEDQEHMSFYRQTPPCLVEDGKVHEILEAYAYARKWGATVSGETIIRRSAVGLSADRKTLFYGLGEAMTAQAIARGMKVAGSHWVAELDVNHAFPRFLFFEHPAAEELPKAAAAIIPAIDYEPNDYVLRPSVRDFFYLTRSRRKAALELPRSQ